MKRNLLLWTGVLIGPVMFLLCEEANFALAPWACFYGWKPALYVVCLIGLVITAGSGLTAWSQWTRLGRDYPGEAGGEIARSRALAMGGVLLSLMCFIAMIALSIPTLVLSGCE